MTPRLAPCPARAQRPVRALRRATWTATRAGLITAILCAAAGPVFSDPLPLVIEAHAGDRPADAAYLFGPIYDHLRQRGYDRERLLRRTAEVYGPSASAFSDAQARAFRDHIEAGYGAWIEGDLARAIAVLQQAIATVRSRPGVFAYYPVLREEAYRGLAALAIANKRMGRDSEARALMLELIRSFPHRPITGSLLGPEIATLYQQVHQGSRTNLASLALQVDEGDAQLFVNGALVGTSSAELSDLVPGKYRIYVHRPSLPDATRSIDVIPGRAMQVSLDLTVDTLLQRSPTVWLRHPSELSRVNDQRATAAAWARSLGSDQVLILGMYPYHGERSVVLEVARAVDGSVIRGASIPIEGRLFAPSVARAMVDYVLDATPSAAPFIQHGLRDRRVLHRWRWPLVAVGMLAIGGGLWLWDRHDTPTCESSTARCPHLHDTQRLALASIVAGTALVGTGLYFWVPQAPREAPDERAQLDGLGIGWSASF